MEDISPDLYTYLSQTDNFEDDGIHEAQLAIIAGADTNAITVSNACYLLCRYPEYQAKLYEELRPLPIAENIIDDQILLGKPYLLSIINETMRLYPPVPGGLQRLTPAEGATVAGRYIPGHMIVTTPTYALHRGESSLQPSQNQADTRRLPGIHSAR
jgi:cytochrome P450